MYKLVLKLHKSFFLKVLSYWNLNIDKYRHIAILHALKVLSYWNLNGFPHIQQIFFFNLKYYHIGI